MKTLFLKLFSLFFFFGVLWPAGIVGRLTGRSAFDVRHFREGSAWDKRRRGGAEAAPGGSAAIEVKPRLGDIQ